MVKKNWSVHIWPVSRHVFNKNSLTHMALNTWEVNFFHKIYPHWILILCRKLLPNFKIGLFWADRQKPFFVCETARIVGPQIHELAIIFTKRTPFQFGFCLRICCKISKLVHFGPIGTPPICPKSCRYPKISSPTWAIVAGGPDICHTNFTST